MLAELLHPLAKMMHADEEEQAYRPRPSLAGPARCIRQMVYLKMGQPVDHSLSGRAFHIFNDGNWHEELTFDWLQNSAYKIHSRQMMVSIPGLWSFLPPEPMIECVVCTKANGHPTCFSQRDLHGHIDGLATDLLGTDFLVEHKGINHFSFEKYWRADEYPEDYLTQLALYLRALQLVNPDLHEGLLLIKNKMTSGFIEYRAGYDTLADTLTVTRLTRHTGEFQVVQEARPTITALAVKKFADVDTMAAHRSLPARPYEEDDWQCRYCPFSQTCWGSYKEDLLRLCTDRLVVGDAEGAMIAAYWHAQQQESSAKKKKEEIGAKLKARLLALAEEQQGEHASGHEIICATDRYVAKLKPQDFDRIVWEAVPLDLSLKMDAYKKTTTTPVLRITQPKAKT